MKKIKIESLSDLSELLSSIILVLLAVAVLGVITMMLILMIRTDSEDIFAEAETVPQYAMQEEVSRHWDMVSYCGEMWEIQNFCEEMEYDNWLLAFAISRLETGNFTSKAYLSGNWGGLSVNEVPIDYHGDFYKGLEEYINLLIRYEEQGYDTPEKIGAKWCPLNPEWAKLVNQIMQETENQLERSII